MRRFSITDKLIIASTLISIVTIMIVASYSFYNAKAAILERTFQQLTSVRVIKTTLLEKFFSTCIEEANISSYSSEIKDITSKINKIDNLHAFEFISQNLISLENEFITEISKKYYNRIFIIGKNKSIYNIKVPKNKSNYTIKNYNSIWDKTNLQESEYIQDIEKIDNQNTTFISISSKITDMQQNVLGIIVFEVAPSSIDSIMLERKASNGLGISGESYLVGSDYLMRSSSRFQKNSVFKTRVKTQAVDSAMQGLSGTNIIMDYRNIKVLSSYSKISLPHLNWAIIAEIDYNEATIPIYQIRNEIIFISIFIFLIVLIVMIVLSRKITFPIQRLNQAAHEIGKGNLNIKLKTNLNDEIGELTDSFNKMAEKLKSQSEEIKKERIKSLDSLIDGQERERQRLSRELHDSLGQSLIGLKLKYESCLNHEKRNDNFNDLGILFDQTIDETRRISNNLMPAALSSFGLVPAIRNICNELSQTSNIHVRFSVEGSPIELNNKIKIYIFRIIQEALTNILKHSNANLTEIFIAFYDSKIELKIIDNGQGFDSNKETEYGSNGINNMRDRISLLSGQINIDTEIGNGTSIIIVIPTNKQQDDE